MKLIHYTESYKDQASALAIDIGGELKRLSGIDDLLVDLSSMEHPLSQWHVMAPSSVYAFYCREHDYRHALARNRWKEVKPPLAPGAEVFLHFPYFHINLFSLSLSVCISVSVFFLLLLSNTPKFSLLLSPLLSSHLFSSLLIPSHLFSSPLISSFLCGCTWVTVADAIGSDGR